MIRRSICVTLLLLAGLSGLPGQDILGGDVGTGGAAAALEADGWQLRLSGNSTGVLGGEIDGDSDQIDLLINTIDLSASKSLWRGSSLSLGMTYEHRHYDIEGENTFFAGTNDPFEDVHTVGARVSVFQGISRTWGAFFRAGIRASAERGADLEDGISANGILGIGHQFTDDFRAGVGVLVSHRFERSLLVIPGIQFDWKIHEHWRLQTRGLGAALLYTPCDSWTFALRGRFQSRRFRLEDDADTEEGIIRDRRIPVSVTATWRPNPDLSIGLEAGLDVHRNFRVEDDDGDEISDRNVDPGFFFGVSVNLRF